MLQKLRCFSLCFLLFSGFLTQNAAAQTDVFSDDFSASAGTIYSTATGPVGSSTKWNLSRSAADYGVRINSDILSLTNDASNAAQTSGWVTATANTASFASPYNPVLASNPSVVTWTFNMRQPRTNPNGFLTSYYGSAFILAGTSGTTNVLGSGYAITLGNTGKVDPIKLVRYTAGIRTATTLLSSNTTGLTDFGSQYLSIKVTYTPSTNTWQLFVRNDGTAFADPNSGTLVSQGTVVNNAGTATSLGIMGAYWNAGTSAAQSASFDNVRVTVAIPVITSISPSSKISGTGAFTLTVNGANFVNGISTIRWNGVARPTTFISPTQLTAAIPASDITTAGTAAITVANINAISNAQTFTIDLAGAPSFTVSTTTLSGLSTVFGSASPAATYSVSGVNLTSPVVTAPGNFEISTNGTTYSASLNLPLIGNTLAATTIYCRLKSGAPAGVYTGSITHTAPGATSKNVSVSGIVLAAQPTTQASNITFSSVTSASFVVNWTNGNGTSRIVVIRSGAAVNGVPVDGISYPAVAAFGSGSELATGNYVVYNGSGNSVTVTGLSSATSYHIAIYDYNGSAATENYLTTTPPVSNRTTLNAPVGWQIFASNTINTINFDTTVDGVNLDTFQADGFSAIADSGELSSNAFAVAGFSDGAVALGGNSVADTDFDRGPSEGAETEGGIYAFETSPDNFSLGVQPAAGDFAPGSITLRFQNQTGAPVTSLSVGYKVFVYNDEPGSSSFNFSHSANNSAYTPVAGLNVISAATADIDPTWKSYYRVVTITGINIANNNYYYLRWDGAAVSGTAFDEFALDDIQLVANPATNFASFSGTANSFVINGNTQLSDTTTIAGDLTINAGKLDLNSKSLTVGGTVTNNVVGGLKGGASANLTITGNASMQLSFDQTTPGTTNLLNNLTVATTNGSTVAILNPVAVNGGLTVNGNQTLNLGTNALTGTLTSININGTLATQNTTALPVPSGKTWGGTGTINYNAATAVQTIVAGTYNHLTSASAGGGVASGALTVNGNLNLPSVNPNATTGSLSMQTYTLTMGANATNIGIGDVSGIITRTAIVPNVVYTLGHAHTSIMFPVAGTLPTSISLKVVIGTAPTWRTGAIKRAYDFIQTGGSGTKAVIKAHYIDSELNGNVESKLVDWAYITANGVSIEQGRSNYNTVDNWVELTNVNVGLYFSSAFDAVRLTLDESEAVSLTWNGSVSNSWTTAANWTPNATPSDDTAVNIPDAATTLNDPLLNPAVLLGTITIDAGGILNSPNDSQFTVKGAGGAWINNGIFNPGGGTSNVIFTNADATIAGSTNFNNLTINTGASLRPATNNYMKIAGTLTNNGTLLSGVLENTIEYSGTNQTVVIPNGLLNAYHNLIISGTGTVMPASLTLVGDLTLNQPVNFSGKTIVMNGADLHSIGGTAPAVFDNLTINNSFGRVDLLTGATINGVLTLTAGNLNIGNNVLTLGAAPVAGAFDASHMIIASGTGEVRRAVNAVGTYFFPIGDRTGTTEYSPITIALTAGSFSNAYIGVSVTDAVHPNNSSLQNAISRYWKVNQSGITGGVATITARYTTPDIIGAESTIATAQLIGTFNVQTNPWVKFAALGSNTLTAVTAQLPQGNTSYFTGIKGDTFTAVISGYGSFCQNEGITLSAIAAGGDAPYTYLWSNGLGTAATAVAPSATAGTVNYTVTVKDANGITATDNANVEVVTPTIGGSLGADQHICPGSLAAALTLTGYNGSVTHWQSSADAGFTNPQNIANLTATLSAAEMGTLTGTTYFRAVVQNGNCSEVFSTPIAIIARTTTWNGNSWSNGLPDSTTAAIIDANFTASANLFACSMIVQNNAVVVVPAGFNLDLQGSLTVLSGSVTIESNANLIQHSNAANSGLITVKRYSSPLFRLDYTMWGSPVSGTQKLHDFSPLTLDNRFYNLNTLTGEFATVDSYAMPFSPGAGYLIRMPNTHVVYSATATAQKWLGTFTGTPNTGNFSTPLNNTGQRYNMIANPYPSTIDADQLLSQNSADISGTIYFWRRKNNAPVANEAVSAYYATYTVAGGTAVAPTASDTSTIPNGVIEVGQGFLVRALPTPATSMVHFNNSMRVANNGDQFFRTAATQKSRIWLNATGTGDIFSQTLIAYIDGASNAIDAADGKYINDGNFEFTSLVENDTYVIQSRPAFTTADVVAMHFRTPVAGTYTIAIDHVDGLFNGGQNIYLRDNLMGIVHDLNSGSYSFASGIGTFDSRFEILYQNALGTGNPQHFADAVVVYSKNQKVYINSGLATIDNVQIYDLRGRLLSEASGVNTSETSIPVNAANQVLVVKVKTTDNIIATRKVVVE